MSYALALALALHVLSATVWVGGMVVLHMCLRPNLGTLEPAQRLTLMRGTLGRFFPLVWAAVVLLPVTGYWMVYSAYGGFAGAPVSVHLMQMLGWIMILLFLHLFFAPWGRMRRAVDAGEWETAGKGLGQIRLIVTVNMWLGLAVVAIAAGGRYLG